MKEQENKTYNIKSASRPKTNNEVALDNETDQLPTPLISSQYSLPFFNSKDRLLVVNLIELSSVSFHK